MHELERRTHQYQLEKQWAALVDRLKDQWGGALEHKGYYARKVLDQGGPELLERLAALPLDVQVTIADVFAASGSGVGLDPEEAIFTAGLLIGRPESRYYKPGDGPEERELHDRAKDMVSHFWASAPGGQLPADPTEPPPPVGAEPSAEAKDAARQLMDTKGPYFNKAHPEHAAVRAKVQGLLAGTIAPQATAPTIPQPPADGGSQEGEGGAARG